MNWKDLLWLAAGVVAGPFTASAATVSLLNNGGFESAFWNGTNCTPLNVSFGAAQYGNWAVGDAACRTSTVTAKEGSYVMRFSAVPALNTSADVYQIVDLTAYAAAIDAGQASVDTSAWVNAASRRAFGMVLASWDAAPTGFGGSTLLTSGYDFGIDADGTTYQKFGYTGIALAPGVRYLAFGLNAPAGGETGTFVDQAELLLHIPDVAAVPLPAAGWLLLSGIAGLGCLGRRRSAM